MTEKPDPAQQPETGEFWRAAADGRLLVKRCPSCGEAHYPPRAHCPLCAAPATHWEETGGTGIVYSMSTMRRAKEPYTIAYVELDEGPRIITNLVPEDQGSLAIGDRVKVQFRAAGDDGRSLPYFARHDG